jgi:two-component system, OmpR family, alkaline phosphatase synthesis response regulator PhoP
MRGKILLVDDEADFLSLLAFNLELHGFQVFTADNGLEALYKARRLKPDVVLLDLMLPGIDGYSICEILRRQEATRMLPIVVLTAANGRLAQLNGLAAGADDFLQKPIQMASLLKRIERLVKRNTPRHAFQSEMTPAVSPRAGARLKKV